MAKKISASDIFDSEDIFQGIKKSAEETIKKFAEIDAALKKTAEGLKKDIGGADFGNTKGINNFVSATQKATKTQKDAVAVDKVVAQSKKDVIAADKALVDIEIKKQKLAQETIRTNNAIAKTENDKAKATEKASKAAIDESNAYKQLSNNTRDLKNKSKELGAQMLILEQSGRKNSKEYRELANTYKKVTDSARTGDSQLKKLDKTVGDNFRNVGNYKNAIGGLKTALGSLGIAFGARQVVGFLKESIELSRIQEKAVAQVAAGLISTDNAVGFSLDELKAKASEFQKSTLFGDEQIMTDLTSVMLTFTNVTGKAFDGAQQAALDLSTRMGGDLKGAAVQLGKALNDPIQGVTALKKVGVSFTDEQKKQIKTLQESGDLYGAQTIILKEMNKEFAGSAKAAADADGGMTQLSNAWGDAKEQLGKMLIEGLKPTITALKEFFLSLTAEDISAFVGTIGTIAKTIGKVILAFTAYLAIQKSIQAYNFIMTGGLKNVAAGMMDVFKKGKQAGEGAKVAGDGVSKAGKAMTAVPWIAIIAVIGEVAMGLFNIATGADKAAASIKAYNKLKITASNENKVFVQGISNEIEANRKMLELAVASGKMKQIDADKERKAFLISKQYFKEISDFKTRESKTVNFNIFGKIKDQVEEVNNNIALTEASIRAMKADDAFKNRLDIGSAEGRIKALKESRNVLWEYNRELKDELHNLNVVVVAEENNTDKIKAKIPVLEKQTKKMKDANDQMERMNSLMQETQSLIDEIGLFEIGANLDSAIQSQLDSIGQSGQYSIDLIKQLIDEEYNLQKAIIERQFLESVDVATNEQEVINAKIRRDFELGKLEEQRAQKTKSTLKDLENAQEDYANKTVETDEKVVDSAKKTYETQKEFIKLTADYFIKRSNDKIAQMDKEIAKAENQYTLLQTLAANGNINAQESLAEQQRIINEANARKEKELKRQQRIKLAESVYSTYNSKVAAGSEHPLMDTIKDTMLLQQFIASLPTFYDGTEDTGKNGNGIDGKGGFHAVLHPNERVIPKSLNEQIGGLSNEALAKMASEYQNGKIIRSNSQIGSAFDTAILVGKLDELTTAIKQKPETNIGIGEITQSVMEIVKSTKQGNTTTYNRYKVRR